jgi:hypothetical protein
MIEEHKIAFRLVGEEGGSSAQPSGDFQIILAQRCCQVGLTLK